jgi:hypothetical protein
MSRTPRKYAAQDRAVNCVIVAGVLAIAYSAAQFLRG